MADPLGIQVGRQRVTRAVSGPGEAGYIRSIRAQMAIIQKNMLKLVKGIEGATPDAIRFGLQPIFDESQRLVPVDTSKLKHSGYVEVRTEGRSGRVRAEIGYGLYGRPFYAGIVHERLDLRHAKGKQAKYLEAAINMHIDKFVRRVGLHIQKATGLGS